MIAALFFDYFVELHIAHLWYYSYTAPWEYAVLYFFIYPAGTIVMIASYLIGRSYFLKNQKIFQVPESVYWLFVVLAVAMLICGLLVPATTPHAAKAMLLTLAAVLMVWVPAQVFAERWHGVSYIHDLIGNPTKCLALTGLATYLNMILHEYPNTYAHEWTYAIHTGTFLDTPILGIALLVWLGWPALVIAPVSFYYLITGQKIHRMRTFDAN